MLSVAVDLLLQSRLLDEGGIVCHILPEETESAIVISMTHVRIQRKNPLAAAVFDYQTHRVKKLKKQNRA
jgi:hypothetical protein